MRLVKNSILLKGIVLFLCFVMVQSGFQLQALETDHNEELNTLVNKFKNSEYDIVIEKLEQLLNEIGEDQGQIRGKFFLLLGASYEKKGIKDKAVENYLLGDLLLDSPAIEGIDLKSLEVFNNTIYGKVINGKRVFEKVGKRKRKKRFPYLAILGAAALVTAVFILMKKKSGEEPANLKEQYARSVFDQIEWIEIPAGEFLMGDNRGLGSSDESPAHLVYLDSYKISKYEITYDQFSDFAYVNPFNRTYHEGRGDNYPVTGVDHENASQFCLWLGTYTNTSINLPTEAQWEKAARGTDNRIYPWGNAAPGCSIVNYNNCNNGSNRIDQFTQDRSYYGVMHMGGNVSEMIRDSYAADYYSVSPYSNPTGPTYGDSNIKVLRGANWSSSDPRATKRSSEVWYRRNNTIGFRIVLID